MMGGAFEATSRVKGGPIWGTSPGASKYGSSTLGPPLGAPPTPVAPRNQGTPLLFGHPASTLATPPRHYVLFPHLPRVDVLEVTAGWKDGDKLLPWLEAHRSCVMRNCNTAKTMHF